MTTTSTTDAHGVTSSVPSLFVSRSWPCDPLCGARVMKVSVPV
jgi:hypothetical protein